MRIKRNNIIGAFVCGLLAMAGLTACNEYSLEDLHNGTLDKRSYLTLTFVTSGEGTPTRSATGDPDGYEAGIEYENDIDFNGGDYKIYFFTYESGDEKGGTLIAEFEPTDITPAVGADVTSYTLTGDVPDALSDVSDFRVVVLANWESYPSVTPGITTIDDLCEGTGTTYSASSKFTIDENNLIPFYGVQEYTDITFAAGTTTTLSTPVSLLRAVAKVEVILESTDITFSDVNINNYNSTGYCAPAGVYTADGYNTDYGIQPSDDEWPNVFVKELHLVNNSNDTGTKTQNFTKVTDATQETWRIYLPEYSNMSTDYSYITVTIDGEEYKIYFAEYTDGKTTAYSEEEETDMPDRYNIKRNNLYRFYVSKLVDEEEVSIIIRVWAEKWEELFDNTYVFGDDEDENP